jgi:hypothetical protein
MEVYLRHAQDSFGDLGGEVRSQREVWLKGEARAGNIIMSPSRRKRKGSSQESAAACDPANKGLAGNECNKTRILYRRATLEMTGAFHADDFGTPTLIGGRRGGRPKGVSRGETIVPTHSLLGSS